MTQQVASISRGQSVDRLGVFMSGVCAVHCALTALLPGLLTALGLGALLSHEAEWAFTVAAIVFAVSALVYGLRAHRSKWVPAVLAVGVVGLLASRFIEEAGAHSAGTVVGVAAGLALVVGHVSNLCTMRRGRAESA